MKIANYVIVSHQAKFGKANPKDLTLLVLGMMDKGWVPFGGVASQGAILYQAMVKYEA